MSARMVKRFAGGNKNDAADARAIWTAVQQPGIKEAGYVYKEFKHPVRGVSIGIDDTYVRSQLCEGNRQFQVTGGRLERNGKLAERFAFVSSAPGWTRDQFTGMLRQHGIGATARIRVITDGDDGLRNFVQSTASADVTQQLDWFHIGMRLERLRKTVQMPMTYRESSSLAIVAPSRPFLYLGNGNVL
jgi:hypothetical protein